MNEYDEILSFWFDELTPKNWFAKDPHLDNLIRERFSTFHDRARKGELYLWRETPQGRLSEIIVLDQFSRNLFRDSPDAFKQDSLALILAQEMVRREWDKLIPTERRAFVYMPYMHSESNIIHEEAVKLFSIPGLENNLKFELEHKRIIELFGRYPHRNQVLGRTSTAQEIEFLETHRGF